MNKLRWNEVVRKTKWASKKKQLSKSELGDLMKNALAMEKFMAGNKSEADRDIKKNERYY